MNANIQPVNDDVAARARGDVSRRNARPVGWKETLRDGTQVLVCPIGADDRELDRSFIEGMSPAARRFRFLDTMKWSSAWACGERSTHTMAHRSSIAPRCHRSR